MLHIIFPVQVDWIFVTIILPGMYAGGVTTPSKPPGEAWEPAFIQKL